MVHATPIATVAAFLRDLRLYDASAAVGALGRIPVSIMCGTRDRVTPILHSQQLAALLPTPNSLPSPVAGTWWVWSNRRSSEKRSIGYLSVRRPITGSIHLQRIWSERDVSVDSAATAVRSMIADIDVDPESDEFLCALDRLWEKMLSERVAEIVGLRREQTWSADEPGWEGNSSLDYYPRRDVWRTTVHTGRTAGGEEVKIPLALLAPVLIGLVPVLAGVTAPANPFVALLVCIGLAAGIEAVGLWWWTRRDPLRLSEEDKTEIGVAVTALQTLISAGGAHVELRLALAASALVDEIRTVPVWESEDLDIGRIRLNLDEQLAEILAHAGELATVRATLGTPAAGSSPQASQRGKLTW